MKKSITITLLLVMIFTIGVSESISAEESNENIIVTVKINGYAVISDVDPYIRNNRVMLPLRSVSEALGAEVEWISSGNKAEVRIDGNIIVVWPNTNKIAINEFVVETEVINEVKDQRIMIPVRYISEMSGAEVVWNQETYTVEIYKADLEINENKFDMNHYTEEDLLWLSRIVHKETFYQSFDAKLAVANIVLNRVNSDDFPNNIHDVIFQIDYHVQFPPAHHDDFKTLEPSDESVLAAKNALEGKNNIDSCIFFNYIPFPGKDDDLYKIIDGEYFYY